jgi:hypothetical protein
MDGFDPGFVSTVWSPEVWEDELLAATVYGQDVFTTSVGSTATALGGVIGRAEGLGQKTNGVETLGISPSGPWINAGGGAYSIDGSQSTLVAVRIIDGAVAGRSYLIQWTQARTNGSITPGVGGTFTFGGVDGAFQNTNGTFRVILRAQASGQIYLRGNAIFAGTVSAISVRELSTIPALQPTDAARGILGRRPAGGRRNLALSTDNVGGWLTASGMTQQQAADAGPFNTGDAIRLTSTSGSSLITRDLPLYAADTPIVFSVYLKAGTLPVVHLTYFSPFRSASFDLVNGVVISSSFDAAGMVSAGNGWWRCWVHRTFVAASDTSNFWRVQHSSHTSTENTSFAWGGQLEIGSAPTPYQRVGASWDVTETGKKSIPTATFATGQFSRYTLPAETVTIGHVRPGGSPTILTGQSVSGAWDFGNGAANLNVTENSALVVKKGVFTDEDRGKLRGWLIKTGGGVSFTPSLLFASGEQGAWYDPSDLSTLFQDAAATVPVTADSQPVRRVNDKSGRGNHIIAPSDAARPLFRDSGGLRWLQFDGVEDYLVTAMLTASGSDAQMWLGVRRTQTTTQFPFAYGANTSGGLEIGQLTASANWRFRRGNAATDTTVESLLDADYALYGSTRTSENFLSSQDAQSTASHTAQADIAAVALALGARTNGTQFFQGRIYQAIYRNAAPADSAVVQLAREFIAAKSGVML